MTRYRHFALALALCHPLQHLRAGGESFDIQQAPEAVVIRDRKGQVMLQYQLTKPSDSQLSVASACYFHPFATPLGISLTDVAPADHLHHRGIFQAWVEMHGKKDADFWGWGEPAPTQNRVIENVSIQGMRAHGSLATFRARNDWKADDQVLLSETLLAILRQMEGANVLDLDFILAPDQALTLSQWAFSGFCVRGRKDATVEIRNADGPVNRPAPIHTQPESDWPDAPWYAMHFDFPDGTQAGLGVMNHPKNPPTLWHNHPGLRMLNPCITAPGKVTLAPDQKLVLRYRIVAYDGTVSADWLQSLYDRWIGK